MVATLPGDCSWEAWLEMSSHLLRPPCSSCTPQRTSRSQPDPLRRPLTKPSWFLSMVLWGVNGSSNRQPRWRWPVMHLSYWLLTHPHLCLNRRFAHRRKRSKLTFSRIEQNDCVPAVAYLCKRRSLMGIQQPSLSVYMDRIDNIC